MPDMKVSSLGITISVDRTIINNAITVIAFRFLPRIQIVIDSLDYSIYIVG